jgi:hypothetical protein
MQTSEGKEDCLVIGSLSVRRVKSLLAVWVNLSYWATLDHEQSYQEVQISHLGSRIIGTTALIPRRLDKLA